MADALSVLEATWTAIAENGTKCTLTRISGRNGVTRVSVNLYGRLINAQADSLLGEELGQTDRLLIISDKEITAAHWPGPPDDNDEVIVAGHTYKVIGPVKTFYIGETPVRHELQIRG